MGGMGKGSRQRSSTQRTTERMSTGAMAGVVAWYLPSSCLSGVKRWKTCPWYASLRYLAEVKTGPLRDVTQGHPSRGLHVWGSGHGGTCWRGTVGTLFCMTPTSLRTPVSPDDLRSEWRCCTGCRLVDTG